ncbi:MAG: DUF937 domain-containing protein [Candidatus Eiseniibacteriota bacterium]
MSNLLSTLMGSLGDDGIDRIGRQLGLAPEQTKSAVLGAIPLLMGAMARNAGTAEGASSLFGALGRDHDGSVLDDIGSALGGGPTASGQGILGHLFGEWQNAIEQNFGRSLGLEPGKVAGMLALLAPLVMGALGRTQRQNGLDANGLASFLGGERDALQGSSPGIGGLLAMLDSDGDGNPLDDLAGAVGKLFAR